MILPIAVAVSLWTVPPQQSGSVTLAASSPATMPASARAATPTLWFPAPTDAERAFQESLDVRLPKVDFDALPLTEVVEWLQKFSGMPIRVDWESLKEIGLTRETSVTYHPRDLEFRHVVSGVFESVRPHEPLTHFVPAISVTTKEPPLVTRCYPIDDVLAFLSTWRVRLAPCPVDHSPAGCEDEGGGPICNAIDPEQYALGSAILIAIQPDAWEPSGGRGTLRFLGSTLVIHNTAQVHDELARLLAGLRTAAAEIGSNGQDGFGIRGTAATTPTTAPDRISIFHRRFDVSEPARQRHAARLSTRIPEVSFQEPPTLEGLCDWLASYSSVPIYLDRSELKDADADLESRIDFAIRNITLADCLRAALAHAARSVELACDVRPSGLLITTAEQVRPSTRIYAVPDILLAYDAWCVRRGLPTSRPVSRPTDFEPRAWPPPAGQCLLVDALIAAVSPDDWDVNGGTASITILGPLLIVRYPFRTFEDPIESVLDALAMSFAVQ